MQVVSGQELLSGAKTQEKQMLRKHPDWRLGCRARISEELEADGELVVRASPRGWAAVEAEERAVEE